MQNKQEQPFESLCAFLAQQEEKQKAQNKVREQLDRAISQRVHEQQARLRQQSFWLFVLGVVCVCQSVYIFTTITI